MNRFTNGDDALAKPLVIGMGNPDRGDDGVGPLVVQRLAEHFAHSVSLIERTGDALGLLDDWAGREFVLLIDAAEPRGSPGTVHRIDPRDGALLADLRLASTHAFGVADAIGLAHALGSLPEHIVIHAIEGETFAPGAPISPLVAAAVEEVVNRVAAELCRNAAPSQPQRDATGDAAHA